MSQIAGPKERLRRKAKVCCGKAGDSPPSLLDAMGCGNLIFAHDNPFNRETLGDCGFYFTNPMELKQAIGQAEKENAELARFREASRSRARAKYRWPEIVARYAALLEETVE